MDWLQAHKWIVTWLLALAWWKVAAATIPIVFSFITLCIVFYDRRPRLKLAARKGNGWYTLQRISSVRGSEVKFAGVVEIYNSSARANAIKSYAFYYKAADGKWQHMDSERYEDSPPDGTGPFVYNSTPLTVAPYSGEEWRVMAFFRTSIQPYELRIKVEVVDLFDKRSYVEVTAYS